MRENGKLYCKAHLPSATKARVLEKARVSRLVEAINRSEIADRALLLDVLRTAKVSPVLWAVATDARCDLAELKKETNDEK